MTRRAINSSALMIRSSAARGAKSEGWGRLSRAVRFRRVTECMRVAAAAPLPCSFGTSGRARVKPR